MTAESPKPDNHDDNLEQSGEIKLNPVEGKKEESGAVEASDTYSPIKEEDGENTIQNTTQPATNAVVSPKEPEMDAGFSATPTLK